MMKLGVKNIQELRKQNLLETLNINAAGLDIGATEIYASVPSDRDEESVRSFKTYTADLRALVAWLQACGIDTVAMEATGIYWITIYDMLEEAGMSAYLVSAQHVKNVHGRKTDVSDCQWIQQLHTYGLLANSFQPSDEIRTVRSLVRHRSALVRYCSAHTQHIQKALELMNLKLNNVLSDITGVTGMKIIRAIVAGERDGNRLAQYRDQRCEKTVEEIAKSLDGNYRPEHLFALQHAVELFDVYAQKIKECDEKLQAIYATFPPTDALETTKPDPKKSKRRKNQAHFNLTEVLYEVCGVDLTQIDGIDALTAQTIISEIGTGVEDFKTVKHFTSWLGLSPNNRITGGKVRRSRTKKTKNIAGQAFRIAARSLHRNKSSLGAYYRRMRGKHGPQKANVATAHKLARIVYFMLRDRTDYRPVTSEHYTQQQKERELRNLQRRAAKLGLVLQPS